LEGLFCLRAIPFACMAATTSYYLGI